MKFLTAQNLLQFFCFIIVLLSSSVQICNCDDVAQELHASQAEIYKREKVSNDVAVQSQTLTNPVTVDNVVNEMFEEFWAIFVRANPEFATFLGVHTQNDKLNCMSLKCYEQAKIMINKYIERANHLLQKTKYGTSSHDNLLIFITNFQLYLDSITSGSYLFPITILTGPQQSFKYLIRFMPKKSTRDFLDIISRYLAFPKQVDNVIELMNEGIRTNMTLNERSLRGIRKQFAALQVSVEDSTFYEYFKYYMDSIVPKDQIEEIKRNATVAISEYLLPAFRRLSDYIEKVYKKHLRPEIGVGSMPNGLQYYNSQLRYHLTDSITPEEIHSLGLREIERIELDMDYVFKSLGLNVTREEFSDMLRKDPSQFFNSSEELLESYRNVIFNEIQPKLPQLFDYVPKIKLKVEQVYSSNGRGQKAYYIPGSLKENITANIYLDMSSFKHLFKYEMVALSMRESTPGRHLQISYAIEQGNLPEFRKYGSLGAFTEGWALYGEYLGSEMGLYENPYMLYGHLSEEILQTCGLVVDTGIHVMGWNRQQAIDFMKNYSCSTVKNIKREVDKYITWPGQACANKYGEIKIKELRQKAENDLSEGFNIREFHDIILNSIGPLSFVEQKICDYINRDVSDQDPRRTVWESLPAYLVNLDRWAFSANYFVHHYSGVKCGQFFKNCNCGDITLKLLPNKAEIRHEEISNKLAVESQNLMDPVTMDNAVHEMFEEYWILHMQETPESATFLGVHTHDDKLSCLSLKCFEKSKVMINEYLEKANHLLSLTKYGSSSHDNLLIFIANLEYKLDSIMSGGHLFPITILDGPQQLFRYLIMYTPRNSTQDFLNIISRYLAFPRQAEEMIELMNEGIRTNMTLNEYSLKDIEKLLALLQVPVEETFFYEPFKHMDSIAPKEKIDEIKRNATAAISEYLQPAFQRLCDYIEKVYKKHLRPETGVSGMPNGLEYYKSQLRFHLTANVTPEEIHALGLREIERIKLDMNEVIRSLGLNVTTEEFSNILRNDSSQFFASADEVLESYRNIIFNEIQPKLPLLFNYTPKIKLRVRPAPESNGKGLRAYYLPGSLTGNKPATFYLDTSSLKDLPKYEMMTLSMHETVPGHHLQVSYAMEQDDVPEFRKHGRFSAFIEGWALYSEYLGYEMGLYESLYMLYGHLSAEIFRACRLVVDTGIHVMGWNRQQAIDFMKINSASTLGQIEREVNRYITWPGQACAYKYGEVKIKELRQKAENDLGQRFNIQDFHNIILKNNGPLSFVEQKINDYIN